MRQAAELVDFYRAGSANVARVVVASRMQRAQLADLAGIARAIR
tara:strand:- start:174 stop:305 length:132 start_codon:yes stop_codon:yes gene_type:complete